MPPCAGRRCLSNMVKVGCRRLPHAPHRGMTTTMSPRTYPIHFHCFRWAVRNACTGFAAPGEDNGHSAIEAAGRARPRPFCNPRPLPLVTARSLDLIAALSGLRNWPEVVAFPDRVAATLLDTTSTGRLAFRLKKRLAVNISQQELLEALSPPAAASVRGTPNIWPAGLVPGV